MSGPDIQQLCAAGQDHLSRTEYAQAEKALAEAEALAWQRRDMDALARLYLPLQEARRQKRQRSGEGWVRLDIIAHGPDESFDVGELVEGNPEGQLLIAVWGSPAPAIAARAMAAERLLYLEVFLGAAYPTSEGIMVAVAPLVTTAMPDVLPRTPAELAAALPPHCLLLRPEDLPPGRQRGTAATFSYVMSIWERLHAPFLAAADAAEAPLHRIELYRRAIEVDAACEPAHQRIASLAAELARSGGLRR